MSVELTTNKLLSVFENIKHVIQNNKILKSAFVVTSLYIAREFGHYVSRKWYSLPPGPTGIPFFGCIFHMIRDKKLLVKLAIRFGPIFTFPLFGTNTIVISDAQLMKQLFVKKDLLNRVTDNYKKDCVHANLWTVGQNNTETFIEVDGDQWQRRRKHTQNKLMRTMNNKHVGAVLKESIQRDLVPYLKDIMDENQLWFPRKMCQYLAFNTLYHTMFGASIERNCALYKQMIHDFDETFKLAMRDELISEIKPLQYINALTEPLITLRNRRNGTVARLIKERVANKNNKQETFIDLTHKLVETGALTEDEEIADVLILFMAGTDTTSSTLDFGVALIAKNTEVQHMVRMQLTNVMKNGFDLKLVHKCPLFRAMMFEIIRIASVAYMGVQHVAIEKDHWLQTEDGAKVRIPAKTMIFPNMDYIHIYNTKDKNWKHVGDDVLCLENFLDDDGYFKMNESFVAFGVGRRDCVGRQLAMKEMQYILGFILMNYKLKMDQEIDILERRTPNNLATIFMSPSVGVTIQTI